MASGTITPGRRRPDDTDFHDLSPGDYAFQGWTRPPCWFVRDPSGVPGNLTNHTVVIHDDGTITVSPSILTTAHDGDRKALWHGWLERGVWREC
jgi:hypothetical protein